jgi:hypothetical protein
MTLSYWNPRLSYRCPEAVLIDIEKQTVGFELRKCNPNQFLQDATARPQSSLCDSDPLQLN